LVDRVILHERHDPVPNLLPPMHVAERMLVVGAVLCEQIRERVVVGCRCTSIRDGLEILIGFSNLVWWEMGISNLSFELSDAKLSASRTETAMLRLREATVIGGPVPACLRQNRTDSRRGRQGTSSERAGAREREGP